MAAEGQQEPAWTQEVAMPVLKQDRRPDRSVDDGCDDASGVIRLSGALWAIEALYLKSEKNEN